jgi:hypothetical protein
MFVTSDRVEEIDSDDEVETSPKDKQKEKAITSLLSSANAATNKKPAGGKLIQEVGVEPEPEPELKSTTVSTPQAPSEDEGPSLMEMMMEAQRAAAKEKEKTNEKEQAKESKKGFGGFKKGFFSASSEGTKKAAAAGSSSSAPKKDDIIDVKPTQPVNKNSIYSKGGAKDNKALVFDDVQKALEEDQSKSFAAQLKAKQDEWMNQSLLSQIESNEILKRGMSHPKCQHAMQLMQSNPQDAIKTYGNDPDVSAFMKEFGRVMSEHFTKLGEQQSQTQGQSSTSQTKAQPIQEIGPLQAEAIKKANATASSPSSSSTSVSSATAAKKPAAPVESEEERVRKVRFCLISKIRTI